MSFIRETLGAWGDRKRGQWSHIGAFDRNRRLDLAGLTWCGDTDTLIGCVRVKEIAAAPQEKHRQEQHNEEPAHRSESGFARGRSVGEQHIVNQTTNFAPELSAASA
jgi:hypothetical protein